MVFVQGKVQFCAIFGSFHNEEEKVWKLAKKAQKGVKYNFYGRITTDRQTK